MNLFTGYFPKQSFGGRRIPSSGFHLLASKDARIGVIGIEYQVKLQIVSLSMQIAGFSETPVPPFLQIGIKVFANPVSTFLQI